MSLLLLTVALITRLCFHDTCVSLLMIRVASKHLSVRLDGQDIDLWELYSSVIDLGGSFKVNQQSLWEQVYIRVFK